MTLHLRCATPSSFQRRRFAGRWVVVGLLSLAACGESRHAVVAPIDAETAFATARALETPRDLTRARVTAPESAPRGIEAPDLTVVGTSTGARGSFALLRRGGSARVEQVRVGDAVDQLVVTAIEFDRIVLVSQVANGGVTPTTLRLEVQADRPPPDGPATPLPAPSPQSPPPFYIEPEIVVAGH